MATFCKKRSGNFFDTLLEFLLAVILAVFVIFDKNPLVSYFALALVALLFVIFLTKNKGIFCLNLEPFHIHVFLFGVFSILSSLSIM